MVRHGREDVRATELIAAVCLAVDNGMGQALETGLAVCLVAVRIGRTKLVSAPPYAALLPAGPATDCSSVLVVTAA